MKISGAWRYVYRAVDQHGQVSDVYVSQRRDIASARRFFTAALTVHDDLTEVITDRAPALANVIEELVPAAWHNTGQYENNRVECDHGRLKARLRPMRGLKTHRSATVVIRGHALIQNLVEATTSSQSTPPRCSGWPPPSTNSDPPSDRTGRWSRLGMLRARTRQQSRSRRAASSRSSSIPTKPPGNASSPSNGSPLERFEGTVLAVTHDRWFARDFDRYLVCGADGSVYESDGPVWDEGRVRRAR